MGVLRPVRPAMGRRYNVGMRLRNSLPWVVLVVALALTGFAAYWMRSAGQTDATARFEQIVARQFRGIDASLNHYESYLRGMSGLFSASVQVTEREWSAYIGALNLKARRDPFVSFGYAPLVDGARLGAHLAEVRRSQPDYRIVPEPDQRAARRLAPVTLVESLRSSSLAGRGEDLLADAVRGEAIDRAVRTGNAALTGRVDGVPGRSGTGPGLIMFLPVAGPNGRPGVVHLLFRIDEMIDEGLRGEGGELAVRITEGQGMGALLFDNTRPASGSAGVALFRSSRTLDVGGRRWIMVFESTATLEARLLDQVPRTILIFGALGSFMLCGLVKVLTRTRHRAELIAARTTRALSEQMRINEYQHEQLSLVNQSAQAGVWDIELPDGKAYFSPRYYDMLGYVESTDGGLPGARSELVHPDDRARVAAARDAHFNGTQPYFDCEYRLKRTDGNYLWVSGRGLASLDGAGQPVRFTGSIIDITQRRLTQNALERQREQLELVIQSVQAGVWDSDLMDGSEYYSMHYRELLQFNADDEMRGYAGDPGQHHPDDWQAVLAARTATIGTGAPYDIEYRLRRKGGGFIWVNARAKASFNSDGNAVRFTGAIIDITKRKEAEFALREANLRVVEAAQAKSTFLATMSHEIRTPLNGVIGSAGLLRDTRMDAEQQDYVETIHLSGVQLLTLIDDILDFSKIESGRMELEDEPFGIATVIEDAFDLVAERARKKHLELLYDIAPDVPRMVYGDITRVRQVLINLAGNAVKFTARGEVYVNCCVVSDGADPEEALVLRFSVRDTGIGIEPDKLQRLFTAFSQVDASTTRRYGGTGLGLAISQRLVGMMGGEILVESEPGRGSTFSFTLATRRAPQDAADHQRAGEIGSIAGQRILIVDDYASNRRILAAQCATWGLWTVETASVTEALDSIKSAHAAGTPFDAVISDMLMPDQDGVDLAREVAVHRKLNEIKLPVIILSSAPRAEAFSGREVPEKWIEAYILKPSRQSQLFNALLDALAPERPFHLSGPDSVAPPGAARAFSGRLRILLAEDNEINQKIAVRMLERLGKSAVVVDDGLKAVDAIGQGEFDCVLMDVQMPELDGLAATRRIAASLPEERRPYVIALTANAMAGDRETCLAAGMNDYLAKPVQLNALADALSRAAQYLARRAQTAAAKQVSEPGTVPVSQGAGPAGGGQSDTVLDMGQVDELIGLDDSGAVLADFIDMYTTQAPQRIAEMAAAHAARDFERMTRVAHSLKGASGNLGAVGVADAARRIELAGQARDPDGVDALLDEIRAGYLAAERALKAVQVAQ